MCFLTKIFTPTESLGITSLDQDVTYNDGTGDLVYSALVGMDLSAIDASGDLKVDNSEAVMLMADAGPFTAESIAAGALDYARFITYRINWRDGAMSHYKPQTGTVGVVTNRDGLAGVIELRSLSQHAKQNYISLYSLTCRAVFGSGGGATCITIDQCGFDATSLWQNHAVSTVGTEEDRVFVADGAPAVNGPNGALPFVPGLLQWLTGDNVGYTSELELVNGSQIELRFGTPATIQPGDTFKVRPDCSKRFQEDCIDKYDNYINFRGEPFIPLSDEAVQSTPNYSGTWGINEIPPEVIPP